MTFAPAQPEDVTFIARRLRRRPVGLLGVAARCPCGHAAVVATYPIRRTAGRPRPFPTLFWLTCPALHRRLSQLEMAGAIAELDGELAADPRLRARLADDHDRYAASRWAAMSIEDRREAALDPRLATLRERGIGGMRDRASVKCLHLHYAHHLAGGNVLGELLERRYGVAPCPAREGVPSCPP